MTPVSRLKPSHSYEKCFLKHNTYSTTARNMSPYVKTVTMLYLVLNIKHNIFYCLLKIIIYCCIGRILQRISRSFVFLKYIFYNMFEEYKDSSLLARYSFRFYKLKNIFFLKYLQNEGWYIFLNVRKSVPLP